MLCLKNVHVKNYWTENVSFSTTNTSPLAHIPSSIHTTNAGPTGIRVRVFFFVLCIQLSRTRVTLFATLVYNMLPYATTPHHERVIIIMIIPTYLCRDYYVRRMHDTQFKPEWMCMYTFAPEPHADAIVNRSTIPTITRDPMFVDQHCYSTQRCLDNMCIACAYQMLYYYGIVYCHYRATFRTAHYITHMFTMFACDRCGAAAFSSAR